MGPRFQLHELALVLDMCPAAVQSLCDHQLIRQSLGCRVKPGGNVEYSFNDPRLCGAAYSRLPAPVTERLHRRAVNVIANRQTASELTPFDCQEIADHCERSGDQLRAANWWLQAGQEAIQKGLNELAISCLESAVVEPCHTMTRSGKCVPYRVSHLLACQVATVEGYASSHPHLAFLKFSTSALTRSSGRTEERFDLLWAAAKYQLTAGNIYKARRTVRHLLWIALESSDKYQILAHKLAGRQKR